MTQTTITLIDADATAHLGAALGALLKNGDVVYLRGDLGAGKSTLARGVIRAHFPDAEAPSPTFTFLESYENEEIAIFHYDFYRLENPDDVWELGLEDALDDGAVLIEWPERIASINGVSPLEIALEVKEQMRVAVITAPEEWRERIARIKIGDI